MYVVKTCCSVAVVRRNVRHGRSAQGEEAKTAGMMSNRLLVALPRRERELVHSVVNCKSWAYVVCRNIVV